MDRRIKGEELGPLGLSSGNISAMVTQMAHVGLQLAEHLDETGGRLAKKEYENGQIAVQNAQ